MLASCTLPWTRGSSQRSSASEAPTIAPLGSTLNLEDERNDSAFCEPEYSNPASFESTSPDLEENQNNDYQNNIVARRMLKLNITADQDSDFVPDYEEVDPVQVQQLRQSLRRHSMHKDMIFSQRRELSNSPLLIFNDIFVERVNEHKHLRIYLSSNLSWARQFHETCLKANRKLALLCTVKYLKHTKFVSGTHSNMDL